LSGRRVATRIDVRPLLVMILVAAGLALFYLSQSTRVAATGYEIDALETTLAEHQAEQHQLIWEIGQARSPAEITERARTELRLVPLEDGAVTFAPSASQPAD
jgi:cell division protein FtsL